MPYRDPRCVFVSDSLGEAEIVANWLSNQDIRADVMNPDTRVGIVSGAQFLPGSVGSYGIEVWVFDTEDVPHAIQLLAEKEMARTARTAAQEVSGLPIDVICEECGTATTFPAKERGTVQECPNCNAYLDVGDDEEEFVEDADEQDASPADGIQLPPGVRPKRHEH